MFGAAIEIASLPTAQYLFAFTVDESSTFDSLEIDSLDMVQLVCDLEERLGLKVIAVRVGAIDFLRDMAVLRVYYEGNDSGDVKNMLKIKNSEYASV